MNDEKMNINLCVQRETNIRFLRFSIIKNSLDKNAQFNFSSRFPRDVIDSARMNSSNSIEPSCLWARKKKRRKGRKIIQ